MATRDPWPWLATGAFTLFGFVLVWLANEQWMDVPEIVATTLTIPSMRILLWMLTLVAAGVSFGMAVSSSHTQDAQARGQVLLAWSVVPFAVLFYFWAEFAMGWLPTMPPWLIRFLYSEGVLTASGVVLGFFLAGMLGRIMGSETVPTVAEPEDVSGDE